MIEFTDFILSKSFKYRSGSLPEKIIRQAHYLCIKDTTYHFDISPETVTQRIQANSNELAIFLYRMGNLVFKEDSSTPVLKHIHWAMRDVCGCELYFSTDIEEGFYITHSVGTVIGSRNKIGKGFRIYQGCTIGHKVDAGAGSRIGNNVTMYANSQILGELTIGDNTVIGCNSLVLDDVPADSVAVGSPAVSRPQKNAELK